MICSVGEMTRLAEIREIVFQQQNKKLASVRND